MSTRAKRNSAICEETIETTKTFPTKSISKSFDEKKGGL